MVDQKIAFRRIAAGLLAVLLAFCHGALTPGQEIPAPPMLELGTSIERGLSGGEVHVYALRLGAGQFFEACVERLGMAVDVAVFSPTGRPVAQGDGAWTNTECDMVSHIAEEPGTYRLEVRPLFPTGAARSYRLKLIALRMPTEIDRHRVLGNRVFASANRRRSRWNEEPGPALAEFQEAVAEWRAAGDRGREALTYSYIATLYRVLGELPRSTEYYEKALTLARAEGSRLLEVEVMASLGYNYLKQGQVLKGVLSAREALNLSRTRGDQSGQCRSLVMLGAITNAAGNIRVSQDYNRQAVSFCRAAPIPIGERVALTQLADSFVSLGEPQQALDYFNQALQVVTPAFDAMAQGHIRLNLARLKLQTGELQEALAKAQSALENFRQFGARDLQGHTRLTLGVIYRALGDDEQSFASFTQALEMSEGTGDQYLKALSYRNLAEAAIRLGRRTVAERYLELAADAFREKGLPSSEVEAFKQRGRLELLRGQPVVAVDEFKQGLAISRKQELAAHETEILWLLGTAYAALNDREQAAESFRQALSQARERRLP
ncbi:MAG TPA: tetratricopeptide repeat protein, partial [Blastocatellia bacterium]|nr:tetratricopeptide repeat protein [Blastocatellia bacterium]